MKPQKDYQKLLSLWPKIREFQVLAWKHGIRDIFQDNGGKLLQMLLITGLAGMRTREGNDAKDSRGKEFEMKSVNEELTSQISTHHHLNPVILEKYRKVRWVFAVYRGIELQEIWVMEPKQLEPWFALQEQKWKAKKKDLNNPKIALKFVRAHGKRFYPFAKSKLSRPIERAEAAAASELAEVFRRRRR